MADIVVVGSINMDLVAIAPRMPAVGETLIGRDFLTVPGGKGANQAYGAGKLGGRVAMVGAIGLDSFGDQALANLAGAGVAVDHITRVPGSPTGVALIVVDEAARNSIIVIPGANATLSTEYLASVEPVFFGIKVLLVQLEIPLPVVERAIRMTKDQGGLVVLDPAPVCPLPDHILARVDFLTPNQVEAEMLTGIPVADRAAAEEAAAALRRRGAGYVLVKLGAGGVVSLGQGGASYVPGYHVTAVDTTAAGDAFNAGLATALAQGMTVDDAVCFANAAAALSVTRMGAQSSMPTGHEVGEFLRAATNTTV